MFSGAHVVIYSNDAEADRALFKTLLPEKNVDAGEGWLIFRLPPAEVAVHPPYGELRHELHMMCDDIVETCKALNKMGIETDVVEDFGFGLVSGFILPGGSKLGFYEPRHDTAI